MCRPGGFSISTRTVTHRRDIRGELDPPPRPIEKAREHLEAGGEVVVDLRELQFMDSSGLRVLVRAHAAVGGEKRFLIVRPPPGGPIAKILAIAGVESQLDLVDDA
jgi:anti-anti-sigma factor